MTAVIVDHVGMRIGKGNSGLHHMSLFTPEVS